MSLTPKLQRAFLLRRAVKLVWQSAPGWTIASLALIVVQGILPLTSLYLTKLVVDAVTSGLTAPDKMLAFGQVAWLIGALGGVTLASALCSSLATLVSEAQSQTVTDHVQNVIHAQSVALDLAYYENAQYHDSLHRAQQEAPYRPTRIVNGLAQVAQSSVAVLALGALLVTLHWAVALVLFVAALPGVVVRLRYANQLYHWQRERTAAERMSWYLHHLLASDAAAKEVRLFDLGALLMCRFREVRKQLRHERLRLAVCRSLVDLVAQTTAALAVLGSYAFIAYQTIHGALTLGDLVMYYQAFQRGQSYLREILGGVAGLYEDTLFLSNLYEFLDLSPRIVAPAAPRVIPRPIQRGIALAHVSFQYPNSARQALRDVSLAIHPGEHIALVGANGSGKTTLVKLLCRLYDPTEGTITLDDTDLREFDPTALRQQISVVFQDYARYHFTARENIWFGDTRLDADDERILAAAQASGADAMITRLPRGYDTVLGKWFDEGEELSIGEWQQIALARAFVRDAPIVVLDEPTSALDAASEYAVFARFHQLMAGRTAILISHRFSTVRLADYIYVLDDGTIVERGSHTELLRQGGLYARLFELQAGSYR